MPRRRKPLEEQKGNLTVEFQKQRQFEESLMAIDNSAFLKSPPEQLVDNTAVKVWKRSVIELQKISMLGNLDVDNLIGFCNAVALYEKATSGLRNKGLIVKTKEGKVIENPLIKVQCRYAQEIRAFGNLCGMTYDSRLKFASQKAKDIDREIDSEFGDI